MNKRQKQVQKSLLKDEISVIKELEKSYQRALDDINVVIAKLLARKDTNNIRSIIYQVKQQTALKEELEAFMSVLHTRNYTLIDDYLQDCYTNSHIGTLFDLQGQGVPLIIPLNQEQMIKAITTNSKLSYPLWNTLGYNVEILKVEVMREISRGIAQELSYQEMARNLKSKTDMDYNKAVRITRTEGHRIQQEATYNVQKRAVERGADVVKQWDATLDGKTRASHQALDGQIIGVDEYFVSPNGYKALYPSGFGVASEDVHCRCVLLQRAKWALSDDEFTKFNGDTNELQHFENVKDYEDFKDVFWGVNE